MVVRSGRCQGEGHAKRASETEHGLDGDRPAVRFDEPLGDVEPQAKSMRMLGCGGYSVELVEELGDLARGDPDALVLNADPCRRSQILHPDHDLTPGR